MRSDNAGISAGEARKQNQEGRWRMPLGIIACAISVPAALCVVENPVYSDGNFETEFMVREIRWDEDCYQVLDDPSVVNRYAFESFQIIDCPLAYRSCCSKIHRFLARKFH